MQPTFLKATKIDTPSAEATGPICRIPLVGLTLHVLAFSARAPVPVIGTVNYGKSTVFSLALGISDFVLQIHEDLSITLPSFLCKNTLSGARLSESKPCYVSHN